VADGGHHQPTPLQHKKGKPSGGKVKAMRGWHNNLGSIVDGEGRSRHAEVGSQ